MDTDFLYHSFFGNSIKTYLIVFGILIIGLAFKRLISKSLGKILLRFFGNFGEELHASVFTSLLIKPLEFLLTIVVLYTALNQLDYPLNEVIFERKTLIDKREVLHSIRLIEVIDKVFLLMIVISFFQILLRLTDFIARVFIQRAKTGKNKADEQLTNFLKELAKVVLVIIGFFVLLGSVFEINVLTLITGLGIGGIAVALAAKESLENLLGSFTIFLDKPFIVGDSVKVSGVEGTVEKVGFRSTQIRTTDKTMVSLPNKKMIDGALENLTLRNYRIVKFTLGLIYETPPESIKKIADEIASTINQIKHVTPDTVVMLDSFGDSTINLQITYQVEMVDNSLHLQIKENINYQIITIVQSNQSDFAYPTRTVIHQFQPDISTKNPATTS